MVSEHTLAFAVGIIGNLISFLVFLAPVNSPETINFRRFLLVTAGFCPPVISDFPIRPTFYRVYKKKSTEGFHSVPYVIALFSCMLWVYYALVKTNALLLITINSFGLFIETVYIVIYLIYAPIQAKKCTVRMIIFLNVTLFGLILAITLLCFHGHKRLIVLGWICVAFSVSVFIAPLSVMRLVIRTKSVEFMPFNLSLFLTISAAVWLGYGVLSKDKYVALPNILGLLFGIIQMVLYCIYKDAKPKLADTSKKPVAMAVTEITLVASDQDVKVEGVIEQIV